MICLVEEPIDCKHVVQSISASQSGAIVTFEGRVRDQSRGRRVTHLFYQAYEEMAYRELKKIHFDAVRKWALNDLAIVHRLGRLEIGEISVFIAAASTHRKEAFEACRYVIDTVKTTVPIWKKEHYQGGEVWIEGASEDSRTLGTDRVPPSVP